MKALMVVLLAVGWSSGVFAADNESDSTSEPDLMIGQQPGEPSKKSDAEAWALLCANEEKLSPRLRRLCDNTFDSPDKLRAATFTGCALATQTIARILMADNKSRDAVDYYRNATDDYLAGAQQLVNKDEFRIILADETRKLRAGRTSEDGSGAEMILQKARQCARALDDAS